MGPMSRSAAEFCAVKRPPLRENVDLQVGDSLSGSGLKALDLKALLRRRVYVRTHTA